jgi:hypothetical protein
MRQSRSRQSLLFFFLVFAFMAFKASAQADYPFRDIKLSDDARIADLLGRLTLEEKVDHHGWPSKDPTSSSCLFR